MNGNPLKIILKNSTLATDIGYVKYCFKFLSHWVEKDANLSIINGVNLFLGNFKKKKRLWAKN
jgi:hypothetical protein